jgi:Cof subfamily protein (haloacid dehalogenase superfamily)
MPMPPTLYVSDLDGTLLDGNARLSPRSLAIIASLLADGLQFSVATARSVVSVRSILAGLPLKLPVVEFNGAFLSDLETGRHLVVHSLPPGLADDLHGLILESGHAPFVSTFDGNRDCLYYDELQNAGMKWYRDDRLEHSDPRLRRVSSTKEALHEQVVCLTVIGRRGPLEELKNRVLLHAGLQVELHIMPHLYSEGWDWLTIHDHRATKDQGIRALRGCCGLSEAELVVFGDEANDVKMFRAADRGIAVANATSELKEVSHAIIGANVDDSVALYLQEAWRDRPENRGVQ